ncbi:TPA: helix-turn-helix transcriptional regulator [Enterobacter hormaechei subsp. steigerwaltii]|nr:helix-turn-helix transcriptional regulator [Enterobacter hormaechei subsp. steigerwaltii]HDT4958153.1 helix-turn-helix transcriptional regulator [Enterobacter kobei]
MIDLTLTRPDELLRLLCGRLKNERLAQQLTQAELALRAGLSVNTISSVEGARNVSFESIIRMAMVLGRSDEIEGLFKPKLESLHDLERYEESRSRQRIRKEKRR